MQQERLNILRNGELPQKTVVYWMSREQRVNDNWALLHSQSLALDLQVPLIVIFCLVPGYLNAGLRQYDFMLKGLKELKQNLESKNIKFVLLEGDPEEKITEYINQNDFSVIITDFNPLRVNQNWKSAVLEKTKIPFHEVDAHNVVPHQAASNKQEWAAYTLRPKINKVLDRFLIEFPNIIKHPYTLQNSDYMAINWEKVLNSLKLDNTIAPVNWIQPGEKSATKALAEFIENKLDKYAEQRNDPNADNQSNLSPFLHFGQISAQRVALEVQNSGKNIESIKAFLEELIVRKELSDNFCYHNKNYDNFDGFPDWAKTSLNEHRNDLRKHTYSLKEFESAKTHDELWNAAQREMVVKGKMHGYMRMYWAKKILEWSETPESAIKTATYLNDKYELDGRDPNGYTGIAWSVGGVHDRAWPAREIFGKVRYMSEKSIKKKFDTIKYIQANSE